MQSTTEAEIWSALLSLCDLLKNAVCIPCPINDNFKLEVSWSSRLQQLFIAPWPFSDPHSTTSLFTDPLDGPNDQWGSISTTVRTAGLEGLGVVHKWRHTLTVGRGSPDLWQIVTRGREDSVVLWCHTSHFDMHATRTHTSKERCGGQNVSIAFTVVFCCNQWENVCRYCQWINCFCSVFPIVSQSLLDLQLMANYIVVLSM